VEEANAAGKDSGGSAKAAILNLGSLASVYNLTTELTAEYPSIHFLFNNAGSTPNYDLTEDGLKDDFGGMPLTHMALSLGLLPLLRNAGQESKSPARVVMIFSSAALLAATGMLTLGLEPLLPSFMEGNSGLDPFPPSFMEGNGEGDLRGKVTKGDGTTLPSLHACSRAKLCNCLFCFEINRRFQRNIWPVIAHAIHTGGVYTQSSATGLGSIFLPIPGVPYLVSNILVPLL
jgi:NAD(P)-dependent dehydrogenase (short-subunit alcohol dehydrogenase family)